MNDSETERSEPNKSITKVNQASFINHRSSMLTSEFKTRKSMSTNKYLQTTHEDLFKIIKKKKDLEKLQNQREILQK